MTFSLQDKIVDTVSAVFREDATLTDLLPAIAMMATFWLVMFSLLTMALRPVVQNNDYIRDAGGRDYDHHGKEMAESLGMPMTREEHIEQYKGNFVYINDGKYK